MLDDERVVAWEKAVEAKSAARVARGAGGLSRNHEEGAIEDRRAKGVVRDAEYGRCSRLRACCLPHVRQHTQRGDRSARVHYSPPRQTVNERPSPFDDSNSAGRSSPGAAVQMRRMPSTKS